MGQTLKSRSFLELFVLIAIGLSVFANTLANDFVWEDQRLVVENAYLRDLKNIPAFFTVGHWRAARSAAPDTGMRPVRETSFALDYLFWGYDPRGYHFTNLVWHLINVILAYFLARRLTSSERVRDLPEIGGGSFLSPAFLTALFFALHPIHVESVAYIKNRSDLLAFAFFQAACLLYVRRYPSDTRTGGRPYDGIAALACFLLSLGAKPAAVVLPLVLVLYSGCFRRRQWWRRDLIGLGPFFVMALLYVWLQRSFLIAADPGQTGFSPGSWRHIETIVTTLGWYLKMLIWPFPLTIYHRFPPAANLRITWLLWSIVVVAVWSALLIRGASGRKRLLTFSLAWVLVALMPVANVFVLDARPLAEQRLYLPSLGYCLALALAIKGVTAMMARGGCRRPAVSVFSCLLVAAVGLSYAIITIERNKEWRDGVSIFSSTVDRSPDSPWARYQLGLAHKDNGRWEEALVHYQAALALDPCYAEAYNAIGAVLGEKGMLREAIEYFETALRHQPDLALAHDNLGLALGRQGRSAAALDAHRRALGLAPDNPVFHAHLAWALAATGALDEAAAHYQMALVANPDDALLHRRLGAVLLWKDDPRGACRHFSRVREIDPDFELPADCRP
jgi:tetratricopeptide (TPR) repeat protein